MLTFLPFCFFTFKNFIIFAPKITNDSNRIMDDYPADSNKQ